MWNIAEVEAEANPPPPCLPDGRTRPVARTGSAVASVQRSTSNIQHPTSNIQHRIQRRSAFNVGCSMFL